MVPSVANEDISDYGAVVINNLSCVWLYTEGGGTDPNINRQLARALEDGKSKDIPNTTMFEALRKMVSKIQKQTLARKQVTQVDRSLFLGASQCFPILREQCCSVPTVFF